MCGLNEGGPVSVCVVVWLTCNPLIRVCDGFVKECKQVDVSDPARLNALCDRADVLKVCCLLQGPVRGVGPRAALLYAKKAV